MDERGRVRWGRTRRCNRRWDGSERVGGGIYIGIIAFLKPTKTTQNSERVNRWGS